MHSPDAHHSTLTTPAIILVRPQLGENIGAAARAMSNFGFSDLRLVAPKNGWPNERAVDMAAGAAPLVESARVFDTLPQAMHDIHYALGTTARARFLEKAVLEPESAVTALDEAAREGKRCALLFGPERTGLENEDIVTCDALVTISTAENASLNLSQCVMVMAYEWFRRRPEAPRVGRPALSNPPAGREKLEGFFQQLEEYLDAANHFRTPDKKPVMWRNLRNIFVRAQLSEQEVRTLRGTLRALYLRRRETDAD